MTSSVFCNMNTTSRPPPASVAMTPLPRRAPLDALPVPLVLAGLGLCCTTTTSRTPTGP